jgi:hypothetical protein
MLTNEEKINLLKIEGKRLVQVYESADMQKNVFDCPVCAEARRLAAKYSIENGCGICKQLGIKERCRQFLHLPSTFVGLACLLDPRYSRDEKITSKKKIKELIFEVKDELDQISKEE